MRAQVARATWDLDNRHKAILPDGNGSRGELPQGQPNITARLEGKLHGE